MKANLPDQAMVDAAAWLTRLRAEDVTAKEMADFGDWLRDAPANVREYLEALAIWDNLGRIDAEIGVEAILSGSNVMSLPQHPDLAGHRPAVTRNRRFAAVAAVFITGVIAVGGWWMIGTPVDEMQIVSTALGEQRSLALKDGSVLHLNTQSMVRVALDTARRHVELISGEALFDVAKDPNRPFTVAVGDTVIQVIGTRFNVRRYEKETTVTVIEGKVAVHREIAKPAETGITPPNTITTGIPSAPFTIELVPGQQASIGKETVHSVEIDAQKVIAWTERRLIFEGERLETIVGEFNRYNIQRMIIADAELNDIRLTGVFGANDIDSFLQLLAETQSIKVIARPDGSRELEKQ